MRGRGNKDNTISIRFRNIKRAFKLAIAQGYADKDQYPFGEGKYRISKNVKTTSDMPNPLTDEELQKWKDLIPSTDIAFAHKMFLCSYYMNGMNFKDMSLLKYSKHFSNGRVAYSRSKTSGFLTVKISEPLQELLDYFKSDSDYVFPVLTKEHKTGEQINYRIERVLADVNKGLRKICKLIEKEPSGFTFYNARDTFTNVLLRNGVHLKVIQQLLGHKSISTTMVYTEKFGLDALDDAVSVL